MKKELAAALCFCLAGILCTCLFGYEYFTTYGFLNAGHLQAFAASDTDFTRLLANILWERGKMFLILWILSLTALRRFLPLLLRCAVYITVGIFLAACTMNMGLWGVLFCLAALFPHGIFYLAAILLILHADAHRFYNRKNPALKMAALYMGMILLFLSGCALEASAGAGLLCAVARAAL